MRLNRDFTKWIGVIEHDSNNPTITDTVSKDQAVWFKVGEPCLAVCIDKVENSEVIDDGFGALCIVTRISPSGRGPDLVRIWAVRYTNYPCQHQAGRNKSSCYKCGVPIPA